MRGFGALPGVFGDQGVSPAQAVSQGDANKAIEEIRDRYCVPNVEQPNPFNLTATTTPATAFQRYDLSQTPHNSFIISLESGSVRVYFGDFGGDVSSTGHLTVPAGAPFQFMLSPKGRVYTVTNASATTAAVGCVTFLNI
jgi:hypothetical protein